MQREVARRAAGLQLKPGRSSHARRWTGKVAGRDGISKTEEPSLLPRVLLNCVRSWVIRCQHRLEPLFGYVAIGTVEIIADFLVVSGNGLATVPEAPPH